MAVAYKTTLLVLLCRGSYHDMVGWYLSCIINTKYDVYVFFDVLAVCTAVENTICIVQVRPV